MLQLSFRPTLFGWVTLFLLLAVVILCDACRNSTSPDVSDITADVHIARFEHDLFGINPDNYVQQLSELNRKYPTFFGLFVSQIMNFGEPQDTAKTYAQLLNFVQNPDMKFLYDTCTQQYSDLSGMEKELTQGMKYLKHYLPNAQIPTVVSHISAFGPAVVTVNDELIGINLDMFMGSGFAPYSTPDFPQYLRRRFRREYIAPNSFKAYAKGAYSMTEADLPHFIDHMAYEGKLLYFLDLVLPNMPDSLKIGYRQKDLDWCQKNEPEVWAYLIDQELLYNTQSKNFYKYLDEAPSTKGMPTESPGRVPIWVGWQMVRKFMQQNPNTTFEQLMAIKDGQEILKRSKYKPKR